MILVINLNTSVDKRYTLSNIEKGTVMRVKSVVNAPGGKGIHVANVLNIFGEECMVIGFSGGKAGEFIEEGLYASNIKYKFVKIREETRSCLAITTDDGVQTELLEPGPCISAAEQDEFLSDYETLISKADLIIASGSLPRGVNGNFYAQLIQKAHTCKKKFLLDSSGIALKESIKAQPYFIKPNREEFCNLIERRISNESELTGQLKNFMRQGIALPTITLGRQGAMAGFAGKVYKTNIQTIDAVNAVGSGDAYVAGIAIALARKFSIEESLKLAVACGTANALEQESGFVSLGVVKNLLKHIDLEICEK